MPALKGPILVRAGTTGEYTTVQTLLLDAGRLYIGGALRTEDGQSAVVVADAGSGARVRWTPELPSLGITDITRVGPAIVVTLYRDVPRAFDVATAASLHSRRPSHVSLETLDACGTGSGLSAPVTVIVQ